jgi:NADH-quinone oxidoreductase subunit M
MDRYVLDLMIFVPLAGMLAMLFVPASQRGVIKALALISTAVPLALAAWLFVNFDRTNAGFQFLHEFDWITIGGKFVVKYAVGVDGISVTMAILTALISFLAVVASWHIETWHEGRGVKGYFAMMMLLHTGMMGVFCALDFFLFYVFWEVMLLPMYFLIGIWGGPRKEYAAIKFFLYTLVGSVLMLVAILAIYFFQADAAAGAGYGPFDMRALIRIGGQGAFAAPAWRWAFLAFFIAFAIKVPSFPFHTWLPDAHVEAPTPISVILASILLKLGVYGILRVCLQMLPEAARWFAPAMMAIGFISIVWGAMCAMAQIRGVPRFRRETGEMTIERDWKKLIAYSSVSHMGFCLIGIAASTPAGIHGAIFQMWNHGIITGMLFLLVGVVYDQAHHRDIEGFGGLWKVTPWYGGVTALAFMASLGLPGLAGFISEALCFIGAFQAHEAPGVTYFGLPAENYYRVLTGFSVIGVVLGASYFLWSYQKIFLGPLNEKYARLRDLNAREWITLAPLAVLTVILGVYPKPVLGMMTESVMALVRHVAMPWVGS